MRILMSLLLLAVTTGPLSAAGRSLAINAAQPSVKIAACGDLPSLNCGDFTGGVFDSSDCSTDDNQYFDFWDPREVPGKTATFRAGKAGSHLLMTVQRKSDGEVLKFTDGHHTVSLSYEMTNVDVVVGLGGISAFDFGSYTMEMICGDSPPDDGPACQTAGKVTCGQVVQSSLRSSDDCWFSDYYADVYEIDSKAKHKIVVSLSMNTPMYLWVEDKAGASGIWRQGKRDEKIIYNVDVDGLHYIGVSTRDEATIANYDFTVECYQPRSRTVGRP
jgi:hypothetical protein